MADIKAEQKIRREGTSNPSRRPVRPRSEGEGETRSVSEGESRPPREERYRDEGTRPAMPRSEGSAVRTSSGATRPARSPAPASSTT